SNSPTFVPPRFTTLMFAIVLQFSFCAAIDAARPDFVSLLSPVCSPSRGPCYFMLLLLLLGGSLLRSLQRIDRAGSGKTATIARRRLGLRDQNVSVTRSGNCSFNQKQILIKIDAADTEVADRHLVVSHVAGHALAGKNARGERRCADRALHLEHV